jgi:site-specific DNA-methyltransferase (adenine-specific)
MSDAAITIYEGDQNDVLLSYPVDYFDFIFADPPYNIANEPDKYKSVRSLQEKRWEAHHHAYDTISDYWEYSKRWLASVQRVLGKKGSLFVTGTHHNIHIISCVAKSLGYYEVADVAWVKPNAMPNVTRTGLTKNVEWVLWLRKSDKTAHYYDFDAATKYTNNGTNSRCDWVIPKPSNRKFKYPGRKPVSLVYRAVDLSTDKTDVTRAIKMFDGFAGSGTTGVAARQLAHNYNRNVLCVLVDQNPEAVSITTERVNQNIEDILRER